MSVCPNLKLSKLPILIDAKLDFVAQCFSNEEHACVSFFRFEIQFRGINIFNRIFPFFDKYFITKRIRLLCNSIQFRFNKSKIVSELR